MDALSALLAELLAGLRAVVAPELCPGGWAWATTLLGVGVGLLPTVGAVAAARLRHRLGDGLTIGAGVLTAGLLPLLLITATGQVFAAVLDRDRVSGLGRRDLRDLAAVECFGVPQADYLGGRTVSGLFDATDPVLFGLAVFAFGALPLLTTLFVAVQARLALRQPPRWPARFFWLPALALPVLTAAAPAGASAHLWLGATAGAFLGIPVVLAMRPTAGAVGRAASAQASRAAARPPVARPGGGVSARPPGPSYARPAGGVAGRAGAVSPGAVPAGAVSAGAVSAGAGSAGAASALSARVAQWRRRWEPVVGRLADRFATREPVPPILLPPERAPVGPPRVLRPTLVVPEPRPAPEAARFQLVRRLGSGGFGKVWLAHDSKLGHAVALKAAHVPDAETEERIRREAKALATVGHAHCVRIHDLVHARSDPGLAELDGLVIVMEYVAGRSLGEFVRERGVLDDVGAARIWAAVAGGLDAAHHRGVLHRDVKPANVVVDAGGRAHLIDFGIARSSGDSTLTLVGWILGTPDFLAPEVARGEPATPASDAWQLAATVSYAMTGHPPRGTFDDVQSGLRAAASGVPPAHLPQRTAHEALLRAALDTDAARRPSLTEVQTALSGWMRRTGSSVTSATAPR